MKLTDGTYWTGQLTSGNYGVFWTHPEYREWHRLIAEFPSEDRAINYAVFESNNISDDFAQPDQIESPPSMAKTKKEENAAALEILASDLPGLLEEHPDGILATDLMAHYDWTYDQATGAARALDAGGHATWRPFRDKDGKWQRKRLMPVDTDLEPPPELTGKQSALLAEMTHQQDKDGIVNKSMKWMCRNAGIKTNSVGDALWALEKRGYIWRVKAGHSGNPAIYKVIPLDEVEPLLDPLEAAQTGQLDKWQKQHRADLGQMVPGGAERFMEKVKELAEPSPEKRTPDAP